MQSFWKFSSNYPGQGSWGVGVGAVLPYKNFENGMWALASSALTYKFVMKLLSQKVVVLM